MLLEGLTGEGKSELLALAHGKARNLGLEVLAARGSQLERELFGRPVQTVRAGDEGLFRGAAELAAPLFAAAPPPGEAPLTSSSFAYVHGLYWLLANLAEHSSYLVVIDDAHWADLPSCASSCIWPSGWKGFR